MPSTVSSMGSTWIRLPYFTSGHGWMLMTSPRRTRRLFRTTLFILIFSSEHVSSERTMHTASLLFFPFSNTVSPLNNCSSSILGWDKDTTLLSSLMASSTINRLGRFFCLRMAVDKSSPFELEGKNEVRPNRIPSTEYHQSLIFTKERMDREA